MLYSILVHVFLKINVLVVVGLYCRTLAFSSDEQGLLLVAVCGLVAVASLVAEHKLSDTEA